MPSITPVRYLEGETAWLVSASPPLACEILIAGDAAGPAPARLAFLENAISRLDAIEKRARQHLDHFVDRARFAGGEDWYLEGIQAGHSPSDPISELTIQFFLESDMYGFWTITLREQQGWFYPVAFGRRQQ